VFVTVAQNAARCASSSTGARHVMRRTPCVRQPLSLRHPAGYTRVIVEKPFGRDLESSRELGRGLAEALTEEQIYRCALMTPVSLVRRAERTSFACAASTTTWARS